MVSGQELEKLLGHITFVILSERKLVEVLPPVYVHIRNSTGCDRRLVTFLPPVYVHIRNITGFDRRCGRLCVEKWCWCVTFCPGQRRR